MAHPKSTSAKILVAEDDVLIALSLQQTLSLFGFEVVGIAATVSDALCLAQNTRPDLAIFDIELAGKRDGIEGAALLRSLLDIPVVFLTGQGDEATSEGEFNPSRRLFVQAREHSANRCRGRGGPAEHVRRRRSARTLPHECPKLISSATLAL